MTDKDAMARQVQPAQFTAVERSHYNARRTAKA